MAAMAIAKIQDEPIGWLLEARPIASMTLQAQERHEKDGTHSPRRLST